MPETPLDPVADRVRDALDIARDSLNPDEALDLVVEEVTRAAGGPYALAAALFRLLDREEADRSLSSAYGTVVQDAMMVRVARAVVDNPNGCTERFAMLLEAVAAEKGAADYVTPVLARKPWNEENLEAVVPGELWVDRSREHARRIVRGEGR